MTHEQIIINRTDIPSFVNEILSVSNRNLLTTKDAAAFLNCSIVTLWKIRKAGNIQPLLVNKKMLFKKEDLINYLNKTKEVIHG